MTETFFSPGESFPQQRESSAQPESPPPLPFDMNCLGALAACHWSHRMLRLMRDGVSRPGAMRRELTGLSQKVQSVCLHKMTRFGLLERQAFPEVPPRVEYRLTPRGREFTALLDGIENLQRQINGLDESSS